LFDDGAIIAQDAVEDLDGEKDIGALVEHDPW
jgi:hypothetical protein